MRPGLRNKEFTYHGLIQLVFKTAALAGEQTAVATLASTTALPATPPYPASAARTETKLQYFILDYISTTTADNTNQLTAFKKNSAHSTIVQVIPAAHSTWSNLYTHVGY